MNYDDSNFPELPSTWSSVRVDELCETIGVNIKVQAKDYHASGALPVIDQGASATIGGYTNDASSVLATSLPVIVFGDHTRALKYIDFRFAAGADGIKVLRPHPHVHPRLFYYFLKSIRIPDRGYSRHFQFIRSSHMAVPPFLEQKRIADKLDAVLARVDACRERLDRVPAILNRFRQSVLAAATSGKLTKEWRNEPADVATQKEIEFEEDSILVPATWSEHRLTDLIDPSRPLCYGVVQPGKVNSGGVPLIRVQDMEGGGILVNELRTVSPEIDKEYRRSRVRAGDLLVSVVGTIGRTAIVPANLDANIARAVARIACRNGVQPQWVNYWLNCDTIQWWLTRSAREVARKTLNLSELGTTRIALPPDDEQIEIVRRVETLFAFVDRLEARHATARERVERLTPALLAKAFRGELVPQDPNDEPASELLKRIQAARATKPEKPKRGMVGKGSKRQKVEATMLSRKDVQPNHLTVILTAQGPLTSETLWAASQLDIDEFYDQLKAEEEGGLLKERRGDSTNETRLLEAA